MQSEAGYWVNSEFRYNMDDIVRQAMVKWPHVPDCYGWLGLDARGHWYLRDDAAQAQGSFDSGLPGAKGSLLQHEKLIDFIHRNYAVDDVGQWYFQNGPQRVYVELEATPWVWRINSDFTILAQTGVITQCLRCITDDAGRVYLLTPLGIGLVHTLDVPLVATALELGQWTLDCTPEASIADQFSFIKSPDLYQRALLKK